MNIFQKIKYILRAPHSARLAKKFPQPKVMSDYETLEYILAHNCSVCRYGDGEFNLMAGYGIKCQEKDKELRDRLNEIAVSEAREDILICVPDIFDSLDGLIGEHKTWWKNYLRCTRGYWHRIFGRRLCGDTNISRFYVENVDKERDKYVSLLKSIWEGKRLLIVEGNKSRLGMGNDLFDGAVGIRRLLCPTVNAFSKYEKILAAVNKEIALGQYDMVICALGPTATVLCYDIAPHIQALDLGHVDIEYEWYLSKAQDKQPVKNKAMLEVADDCDNSSDEKYISQIIGEIS